MGKMNGVLKHFWTQSEFCACCATQTIDSLSYELVLSKSLEPTTQATILTASKLAKAGKPLKKKRKTCTQQLQFFDTHLPVTRCKSTI